MAVINEEEKSKSLSVSGEQIEDAVSKIPTLEADIKTNAQNISRVYSDELINRSAIEELQENKANADNVYTKSQVDNALSGKVSAEEGKGLSSNDYTTEEKTKLSGLKNYDDTEINKDIATNQATLGYRKRNFYQHSRNDQTISGITFTVNDDKSFTMNGTATQLVSFMTTNFQTIPQGKYLCSGCDGGSSSTYYLRLETSRSADQSVSGNVLRQTDGEDVPITVDGDYDSIKVNIVVQKGVTVENVRIAPMIRADYDDDATYEPYQPDVITLVRELQERIAALETTSATSEG